MKFLQEFTFPYHRMVEETLSSRLASGRKKYGLKRFLAREADQLLNRALFRSDRQSLIRIFRALGLHAGTTVCVHASLSQLGYVEGGADCVIDALLEVIGPDGCLVMPSFSMAGTMEDYLAKGMTFDVRTTPSHVGAIAETFRKRDGVLRSLHPTNSLTAYGNDAAKLLALHEESGTPYGLLTPYGRMAEDENAQILMINTHVQSLLHHIQERVEFPNLFLKDEVEVTCVGYDGKPRTVKTKVMRPKIPYFVAIPALRGPAPDWALLHDFALMFPRNRNRTAAKLGYRFDGCPEIHARRRQLARDGILTSRRIGRGEIGLLNVSRFITSIQPAFEASIETFRRFYNVDYLESMQLPFG